MPFSSFLLVWSIVALNTTTPGPNVVNTIATAMSAGRVAGLGAACGVGVGIVLWCLASSLGFATLFSAFPMAQTIMGVIAAVLLGWLALRALYFAWRGFRGARRGVPLASSRTGFGAALLRAVMISATNPKVLTTWLSIATLIPVAQATGLDIALLAAVSGAIGLFCHSLYATIFSTGPAMRFYMRAGWVIYLASGLFFGVLAVNLILRQLSE